MNSVRYQHGITLLNDGKVLVTGGNSASTAIATSEIFNPSTGTWTASSPLQQARISPTVNKLADGRVFVIGGSLGSTYYQNIDIGYYYAPLAISVSGGTAPYSITEVSNTSGYSRIPSDESKLLVFPSSDSDSSFYVKDSFNERSENMSLIIMP
jgi:hypothetical protein